MPDGSYLIYDIQDYFEFIIKKQETLTENSPIKIYPNKVLKVMFILSFARKFGDKYCKKLMDTGTKIGMDAAKTASKQAVQNTAEAAGDLIGNKIADKITSLGKAKSKKKEEERQEICIPPETRQQIIDDLKLF